MQTVSLPVAIALLFAGSATYAQAPAWRTSGAKVVLLTPSYQAEGEARPFLGWVNGSTIDPWGQMTEDDMTGVFVVDASEAAVSAIVLREGSLAWAIDQLIQGNSVAYAGKPLVISEEQGPNGLLYTLTLPNGVTKNFRFAPKDFHAQFETAPPSP